MPVRDPYDVRRIPEFSVSPISVNLNKAKAIKIQCPVLAASSPAGCFLALRASADDGRTWHFLDGEDGPKVPLHEVRERDGVTLPVVGAWVDILTELQRENVVIEPVIFADGSMAACAIGNVYVFTTSVDASVPPPSDYPGPIPPPTGRALGDLLLDLNAYTLLDAGTADGASVTMWNDDSGNGNHAVSHAGHGIPTFTTTGFTGGRPALRCALFEGLRFAIPSQQAFTLYFVMDNIVTHASTPNANYTGAAALITNSIGSSTASFGVAMRADGRISHGVGENAFVTSSASALTTNAWDDSSPHVHAFVRQPAGGNFDYYVDGADESPGGNSTGADMTANPYCYIAVQNFVGYPSALDCGRVLWYNAAHGPGEVATVTDYLRNLWGTP